jgi:O-methyltransferase
MLALSFFQLGNIILVLILVFLAFKILETKWSYKISKPYAWGEAVRKGEVSSKLKKIERFYRDKARFYAIWFQIRRLKRENISGAFAEVGVYQGETAKMIHEMDSERSLHLFDTFQGFAKEDIKLEQPSNPNLHTDFSDTSIEQVKKFVDGNANVFFHVGYFPSTTEKLTDKQYAFVHLDADLYQPTLAGLRYFYPRLTPGGLILIHDYNHNWSGVTKAVDEFLTTIPEGPVELMDWQGSLMIIKNKKL